MIADPGARIAELRAGNARLRDDVSRLRLFVDSLQEMVAVLDAPSGDEQVTAALAEALARAVDAVQCESGALLVLDEDSEELVFVHVEGDAAAGRLAWQRVPASAGITGWALRHCEAIIVNDARAHERFDVRVDDLGGRVTHSVLAVPVTSGDRAIGLYDMRNKRGRAEFDEDDQAVVALMGRFAGELLQRMAERQRQEAGD